MPDKKRTHDASADDQRRKPASDDLADIARPTEKLIGNWINLAILLLLMGLVFGQRGMLVLPIFMLVILIAGGWWNSRALRDVTYRRHIACKRAFPGETVDIEVQVENAKALPVPWLRVEDEWPLDMPPTDRQALGPSHRRDAGNLTNIFALRWYERVRRHYTLQAGKRGVYGLGPTRLRSGDMFGLFQSECEIEEQDFLIVYPRVVPLADLGLPSKEPFGNTRARHRLFEDPCRTMGARDLRPGDSFRHVHWPATARRQQLQARVFEPTTTMSVVICLNVATFPRPWEGILPDLLERAVSVAASLAAFATENRYPVGLISNGAVPRSDRPIRMMPGRNPDQLTRILELLAAVTGYVTVSMDRYLLRQSPGLPWGATLVVVTPVVTSELLASIYRLHSAGRRMVLVSLAKDAPPTLPGVVSHHLPGEDALAQQEPLVMPNLFAHWREVIR
jgi:uncharacterized protein (DUF58 family)